MLEEDESNLTAVLLRRGDTWRTLFGDRRAERRRPREDRKDGVIHLQAGDAKDAGSPSQLGARLSPTGFRESTALPTP